MTDPPPANAVIHKPSAAAKFRGLLESAPDAMVIVNKLGAIVLANSQIERLFGYDRAELLGKPVEILVPERFRGRHPEHRTGYFLESRVIADTRVGVRPVSYLLNAFGHDTLVARDGQEGLEAALQESPDLIICDVELPKLNGIQLARRLKCDTKLCWIPLMAVTAFAMDGDRTRMLAAGFDAYIPKPIAPERFVSQVEAFLRASKRSAP